MTTFADLMKSFDERADKSVGGKFWLTEKQFNYAAALAIKAGTHISVYKNFRTHHVGKNAQYWSTKHFAHDDPRGVILPGRWAEKMGAK